MRIWPGSLHLALLAGTALVAPAAHAQRMPAPGAAPVLDRVVAGGITIRQDAAATQVTQAQARGIVDWRSFDVGRDHAVQFRQPSASAATLNRVTGPDPSVIAGRITANGQIAIVNRSGVVFARGAQVEAAGLIASAAGITNENFLAGGPRLAFDQPAHPGARVENAGTITIREAGLAGLVAPQVVNRGTIVAHAGRVALGGAEAAVIDLHGDGLVSLEITRPVARAPADGAALVSNIGTIEATGGTVLLTAQAADGIVQDLVRAGGRISAATDAATGRTGQVALRGTGGAIIIEGDVAATGTAPGARGGSVTALADRVLVAGTGRVDASGAAGGGSVGIGAEARPGTPRIAQRAGTAPGAVVRADATQNGPGGTIRIDSLAYTAHAGTASARGGPGGGDGGMIEVSGGQGLRVTGAMDISAPAGRAGTALLDPVTLDVVAGGGNVTAGDIAGGILAEAAPPANALIDAALINGFAGNLRLEATSAVTVGAAVNKPAGDLTLFSNFDTITVNAPVVLGGGDLLLQAGNQIALNANLSASRVDLLAGGSITQLATAGITAATLNVQSTGFASLLLGGTNAVGTLVNLTNIGNFDQILFRNLTSLDVTGTVGGSSNAAVRIEVTGDLRLLGTSIVTGQGALFVNVPMVALLATGNLTVDAGAVVQSFGSNSAGIGNMALIAAWNGVTDAPDLAAPGRLSLAGTVSGSGAGSGTTLVTTLGAGTGGIVQAAGAVQAVGLVLQSGGDALLDVLGTPTLQNEVGTLLTSTVAGDLRLTSRTTSAYGGAGVTLDGTQTVGGTMRLDVDPLGGAVTQLPAGIIDAARFEVSAASASLPGANLIGVLGTSPVSGTLFVHNVQPLTVQGSVGGAASGGVVNLVVDAGDLTVDGTVQAALGADLGATAGSIVVTPAGQVTAGANTVLRAGGDVIVDGLVEVLPPAPTAPPASLDVLAAGSVALGATGTLRVDPVTGTLRILAAYDGSSGTVDPTQPGGIRLAGAVSGAAMTMGAGTTGIVQTGGSVTTTGQLFLESAGDAVFDRGGQAGGTPNAVTFITAQTPIAGDLVLDNGITDIEPLSNLTAANIGFRTAGGIDGRGTTLQAPGGRIALRGGSVLARNYALISADTVEIAPDATVPMSVGGPAGPGFHVAAADLSVISATDTLRLGGTTFRGVLGTTAASVRFIAPLAVANRLDVRSLGAVGQDPGADITAALLAGQAGGAVLLANPGNAIAAVEDFAAGGPFTLVTAGALGLVGHLDATGQVASLTAGAGITGTGTGRVSADTLVLDATGAIALPGANAVRRLGPATTHAAGGLTFANIAPGLTIPAGALVDAGGAVLITQAGGPLTVDGTVAGDTVFLSGDTALAVNGFSAIARAGDLVLSAPVVAVNGLISAAGNIIVLAPQSATLGGLAVAPAGSLLVTSPAVLLTGLDATGTAVTLDLGAAGTAGGSLGAGALLIIGGSGAVLQGSIGGVATGAAAALGRRANAQGVLYGDPPPDALRFLFNGCRIATAVCQQLPVTLASNPWVALSVLDPALDPTSVERLRPDTPDILARLPRDRSEEGALAPADIRAEDY